MRKYGKAWENRDPKLILGCFTENGVYQESPLLKPYIGHKEIEKFWHKLRINTKDVRFELKKCYVSEDGKIGFAEWECKNKHLGKRNHMVGIMILKMKGKKISHLNEYWNTRKR